MTYGIRQHRPFQAGYVWGAPAKTVPFVLRMTPDERDALDAVVTSRKARGRADVVRLALFEFLEREKPAKKTSKKKTSKKKTSKKKTASKTRRKAARR